MVSFYYLYRLFFIWGGGIIILPGSYCELPLGGAMHRQAPGLAKVDSGQVKHRAETSLEIGESWYVGWEYRYY